MVFGTADAIGGGNPPAQIANITWTDTASAAGGYAGGTVNEVFQTDTVNGGGTKNPQVPFQIGTTSNIGATSATITVSVTSADTGAAIKTQGTAYIQYDVFGVTTTPEPATFGMLGIALSALCVLAKRKK